jgi:hypothetical protein
MMRREPFGLAFWKNFPRVFGCWRYPLTLVGLGSHRCNAS